jgi:kinesin family member C1
MEYIKKLRACIKWLLEGEDANLAQIGKLIADLEAAETQHANEGTISYLFSNISIVALFLFFCSQFLLLHQLVAQLQNALQESKQIHEELKKQNASLQETLQNVEAEKKVGAACTFI